MQERIVDKDRHSVQAEPYIHLNQIRPEFRRATDAGPTVFGSAGCATVSNNDWIGKE